MNKICRNLLYPLKSIIPKKYWLHPSGTIHLSIKNHGQILLKTNQTSAVAKELFWAGALAYEYAYIFTNLAKKSNTILDIGASIGFYSILAAKANKSAKIYSFEPAKGVKNYLTRNVLINKLAHQIKVVDFALSNQQKDIEFFEVKNPKYLVDNLSGEHNIGSKQLGLSNKYLVKSTTLDSYIAENKIESIDLIKIDTEGSENLILQGGINSIANYKPIIICETLFNTIEHELEKTLKPLGYRFYNHLGGEKLQEVSSLKRTQDNGVRNCFFVHPAKRGWIEKYW